MATTQTRATDDEARPEPLKEIRLKPDTLARLAASNTQFARRNHAGERRPNLSAIARHAGMSKGNFAKFVNGEQPLTLNIVNVVIAASGLPWLTALETYFEYGTPHSRTCATAPQHEMAMAV